MSAVAGEPAARSFGGRLGLALLLLVLVQLEEELLLPLVQLLQRLVLELVRDRRRAHRVELLARGQVCAHLALRGGHDDLGAAVGAVVGGEDAGDAGAVAHRVLEDDLARHVRAHLELAVGPPRDELRLAVAVEVEADDRRRRVLRLDAPSPLARRRVHADRAVGERVAKRAGGASA